MYKYLPIIVILLVNITLAQSPKVFNYQNQPRYKSASFDQQSSQQDKPDRFKHAIDFLTFKVKHRNALTFSYGHSYDPTNDINFLMLNYHQIYRYKDFALHDAPDQLHFKLEYAAGMRTLGKDRLVLSFGFFAMYYLDPSEVAPIRPFIDAGVGGIYTDFQNKDQGLRLNFNPRASLGVEIKLPDNKPYLLMLRAHHISNGGIDDNNRGINSLFLMFGKYF